MVSVLHLVPIGLPFIMQSYYCN